MLSSTVFGQSIVASVTSNIYLNWTSSACMKNLSPVEVLSISYSTYSRMGYSVLCLDGKANVSNDFAIIME